MKILNDNDEQILKSYLNSYKECFEAMDDLLCEISSRIELTEKEKELAKLSEMKYKNMVFHIRKWNPGFRKLLK